MYVLFVNATNKTLWQLITGRNLNWIPLPASVKTVTQGELNTNDWYYGFNTKSQALKARKIFNDLNKDNASTFTTSVRERKTLKGLSG